MKETPSSMRLPVRRGSVEFCLGSEADHEAIYQTLLHVFHGPDREAVLGSLSDPSYKPEQRLLARVEGKVASHAHLTDRIVRYGSVSLPMNGVMWVGTLPEYRGQGYAQELLRLADERARASGALLMALTTAMPRFYRPLGWGLCGKQTLAKAPSRTLPLGGDAGTEGQAGPWHVRPWRQVELGDLMRLYDQNYGHTTGSIVRSEEYWRWIIGRKYAHVIWVACLGEAVHGYAFVKDHKILELAVDPAHPAALPALLGRVRSEALERAYPEVVVHAPLDHPVIETFRQIKGTILDVDELEGSASMYHIPDPERFLRAILPELSNRVTASGTSSVELGLTVADRRYLLHIEPTQSRTVLDPDRLGRRHVTLTPDAFVRLVLGHTDPDSLLNEDPGMQASTATALDSARILFPRQPIWRSPLDAASA